MEDKVIGIVEKNTREQIRVTRTNYRGYEFIDVRVYWKDETTQEWKPSSKGISLSPKTIPQIVEHIITGAEELGL